MSTFFKPEKRLNHFLYSRTNLKEIGESIAASIYLSRPLEKLTETKKLIPIREKSETNERCGDKGTCGVDKRVDC
jgi:hypothetical protein